MREELLQFVWQCQLFNKSNLITAENKALQILKQGQANFDSGPDFSEAKIVMDGLEWIGDVEIHYKSSMWNQHRHQTDPVYNKTILHVVWEHDAEVKRHDGTCLPTLVLKDKVEHTVMATAEELLHSSRRVPCEPYIASIDRIHFSAALNRALIQRLEAKSDLILQELERTDGNWEEVAYLSLAQALGSKVNGSAFKQLASRLSLKILKQYAGNVFQLEALLFGISGMLMELSTPDAYERSLLAEFKFLAKKHGLANREMELAWWKFMRLRPANFPTLRIAQLAQLIAENPNVFSFLTKSSAKQLNEGLKVTQSEYWQNHYRFRKKSGRTIPGLGQSSVENIIVNTSAPLKVAYGRSINDKSYTDEAISLLSSLTPEKNRITKLWNSLQVPITNAAESQGSIELYNTQCSDRQCLSCSVGYQILKQP
jgi:hypothetical protein